MATVITDDKHRRYPLNRPTGWIPKLPRWTLKLPAEVTELSVLYIGIQRHDNPHPDGNDIRPAADKIEEWIRECAHPPSIVDRFETVSGRDCVGALVWVCYWINRNEAEISRRSLKLLEIHGVSDDDDDDEILRSKIGVWIEVYSPDLTRFETNYSGDDYRPGLAQLLGTEQVSHGLTGYWGAARDRMYASAYDSFEGKDGKSSSGDGDGDGDGDGNGDTAQTQREPNFEIATKGVHLRGSNRDTIAHIRSGQFWENCTDDEREAYENDLEPHLRNGLKDIEQRPRDLGDYGLRFLRNLANGTNTNAGSTPDTTSSGQNDKKNSVQPRKETCAAGFFRSLSDLEAWAKGCPSHHKIYGGSINHRKRFGTEAKMRTWHEICVLMPGEAHWEYLNCLPGTGTLAFQDSEVIDSSWQSS